MALAAILFVPSSEFLSKCSLQSKSHLCVSSLVQTPDRLHHVDKSRIRNVGTWFPTARSHTRIRAGFKLGKQVEMDSLPSDVRRRAVEAVESCGCRVTVGDVASKGGLKLNDAQKALQALASDTGGFLEVSNEGDVIYIFPKDYWSKLISKSFSLKCELLFKNLKAVLEYLIRVSFGTTLVASILVVYTTIVTLMLTKSEDEKRERRGGRSHSPSISLYFDPYDLFWYWNPRHYKRHQGKKEELDFVESIFSFVFGDEDPNKAIEEKRWKLIGQYISANGGVVAAEEIAPYLDISPDCEALDDESYMLPVLLQFDGHPAVDDEGNILYAFPTLQRTALSGRSGGRMEYINQMSAGSLGAFDQFLEERELQFSKTGPLQRAMAVGLGALNLSGVMILGSMLKNTHFPSGGFITFVNEIYPLLQIYAACFFTIPIFRWFFLLLANAEIEKRNQVRKQRAFALKKPNASLRQKIGV